jgi:hypothetical protein
MRRQNRYLQAYVVALILMVLVLDIASIFSSYEYTLFCFYSRQQAMYANEMLRVLFVLFAVAVGALTDGILVSKFLCEYIRCEPFKMTLAFLLGLAFFYGPEGTGEGVEVVGKYILDASCVLMVCYYVYVQKDMYGLCSVLNFQYFLTATGLASIIILGRGAASGTAEGIRHLPRLEAAGVLSNTIANLYTTTFLTTRLLLHRRMLKICLGKEADTSYHIHLVNIFLESAATNVPLTICAAVGLINQKSWGTIILIPAVPSQVSSLHEYCPQERY